MVIKPLLAFLGAPNLDSVVDEPFHDEGRFVIAATQPVKHEYKMSKAFSAASRWISCMASRCLADTLKPETPFRKTPEQCPSPSVRQTHDTAVSAWGCRLFRPASAWKHGTGSKLFCPKSRPLTPGASERNCFQNRSDGGHGIISRKRRESEIHMESIYLQRYHVFRSGHSLFLLLLQYPIHWENVQ